MNKELDIQNIKKALLCYIKENGYTKSSFAKKCDIDYQMFTMFFNEKLPVKRDIEEAVINIILEEEKITIEELMDYINKSDTFEMKSIEYFNNKLNFFKYKKRNPDRIPLFLKELEEFWILNPDLRFGQILSILEKELEEDIFNAEEYKWILALDRLENRK